MPKIHSQNFQLFPVFKLIPVIFFSVLLFSACDLVREKHPKPFNKVHTFAGINKEFGEPFGIAIKKDEIYLADGDKGKIWRVTKDGKTQVLTDKLNTPSHIVFDKKGDLVVADAGTHTIKKILKDGRVELIAGVENKKGFLDGKADTALFNAPIGVTVFEDKIYVADTYNDKIRLIENGRVTTYAGGEQGFADGINARFDTPTGLAVWSDGRILVADSANHRIRVIEQTKKTWTLTGKSKADLTDGLLSEAEFVEPTAIALDKFGSIYIADGNAIRVIGRRFIPIVETISDDKHGFQDGRLKQTRFNRPSGLAFDETGNMFVADSDNQLLRVFTGEEIGKKVSPEEFFAQQITAKDFRTSNEPRWTYDPPKKRREIAGTFGEIRGEITGENSIAYFHNGLDIVGGYGETARFIKNEKILRPNAARNFATTRESIRMPTIGYVHIRLGRDVEQKPFDDRRFQFSVDEDKKLTGVRIARGTAFKAGEAIGTLNKFNHVHLIVGRNSREMNGLEALDLPDASDTRVPVIEKIDLYDQNWRKFETEKPSERIKLVGKVRIVVQSFDQMDGNLDRRKLGLYKIGYQIFNENQEPNENYPEPKWTIKLDRSAENEAVRFVYAEGSQSGATGETIFRYIATNEVSWKSFKEDFFDADELKSGNYTLKVLVADFFGNTASEDINFEIK